jgi:hypothetical protein
MKALVVCETVYGNTREAVAKGPMTVMDVAVISSEQAAHAQLAGVDLLVVGGPTHAFGMSRKSTREGALKDPKHPARSVPASGVREWLEGLPKQSGLAAAAFDTRVPQAFGNIAGAAKGIASQLKKRGCKLVVQPERFVVEDADGPLLEGEAARAEAWGKQIATLAAKARAA